ncbi:MAG: hypothetical protein P3B98_09360 [Gemmatimonadota bacterium]|nr:hypothetical protein [Gemmatimonadota bacterium]
MMPLFFAAADTLLVRQVPPDRTGFESLVFIAGGAAQVVTLVVVILLAVIFFRMWKAQQAMQAELSKLGSKIDPMIASATSAAENVRVLTDAVRHDAVAAAEALSEATTRVRDSVSGIADRIDDFGELMGRVTDKTEAVAEVAGAAATAIKAGSRLFTKGGERGHSRRSERDSSRSEGRRPAPSGSSDDLMDEPVRLTDEDDSPYAAEHGDAHSAPRRRRHRRRRGSGGAPGRDATGRGDVGGDAAPSA